MQISWACRKYHLICLVLSVFCQSQAWAGLLFNDAADQNPTHPFSPEVIPPNDLRGQDDEAIPPLSDGVLSTDKRARHIYELYSNFISVNIALGPQESGLELRYNMPEKSWLIYSASLHYDTRSWQDVTFHLYGPLLIGTLHYQVAEYCDPYLALAGGFQHWQVNTANSGNQPTAGGTIIGTTEYGVRIPLTHNFSLMARQKYAVYPSGQGPEEQTGKPGGSSIRHETQILFSFAMTT